MLNLSRIYLVNLSYNDGHNALRHGPKFMFHNEMSLKSVISDCENLANSVPNESKEAVCRVIHYNVNSYLMKIKKE